jgi:ferredoxin
VSIWVGAGQAALGLIYLVLLLLILTAPRERHKMALWRAILLFIPLATFNSALYFLPAGAKNIVFGMIFAMAAAGFLALSLRLKPWAVQEIVGTLQRTDERDTIFARFELQEGNSVHTDYYRKNPELKEKDHLIKNIPDILSEPHRRKNPWLFSLAAAEFDFLERQIGLVDGEIQGGRFDLGAAENTRMVKDTVRYLGSPVSGIARLNPSYIYSHVGRGPKPYGSEIKLEHKYAISFALEMDLAMVAAAPGPPVIVETGRQYVEAARISLILADLIRRLGYPARAHIAGSNYQAVLPPVAWEAGLGEIGRIGILITEAFGPRARLGLVTTDLPLLPDAPHVLGIQDFCSRCFKCARNCPAQAIPDRDKIEENGVLKWVLDREKCYEFWRRSGTDCAVCLSVCPYSHADSALHRISRRLASQSRTWQALLIRGDDFFYGRGRPRGHPRLSLASRQSKA